MVVLQKKGVFNLAILFRRCVEMEKTQMQEDVFDDR